jgi:hypothetical protein
MQRRLKKTPFETEYSDLNDWGDLDDLLHAAQTFEHPSDVVNDPELTLNEKRAILASWASDACALKAAPLLRLAPGVKKPVSFDDVVEALRALDRRAQENNTAARYRRSLRRHRLSKRSNSSDGNRGHGHTLH